MNKSIVKFFIFTALFFGVVFIAITPPFQSPDEDSHFKKAYVLSNGDFFPEVVDGKLKCELPVNMVEYISEKLQMAGQLDKKITYSELIIEERLPQDYSEKQYYNFSTITANPVAHIVPAFGIMVGKVFAKVIGNPSPSVIYYLYFARLANLMSYIIILAISIWLTPILKKTLCMFGLMPMSLFLASAVSYDPLMIGTSFLAFAIILRLAYLPQEEFDWKYILTLGVIAFVIIVVKIVYLPIYLLLLVLPYSTRKNKKEFIFNLLRVLAVSFMLYFIFKLISLFGMQTVEAGSDSQVSEQIHFVMQHPIRYMQIFFVTIKQNREYYLSSFIGSFGLIDTNIYHVFLCLFTIIMMIVGVIDASVAGIKVSLIGKVSALACCMATVFGSFLAMYLLWTSVMPEYGVGASTITGIQGRYFIPIAPVIFLVFSNNVIKKNEKIKRIAVEIADYCLGIVIAVLAVSVLAALTRFWC